MFKRKNLLTALLTSSILTFSANSAAFDLGFIFDLITVQDDSGTSNPDPTVTSSSGTSNPDPNKNGG